MRQKIRLFFASVHDQLERWPFGRQFMAPEAAFTMDHRQRAIVSCYILLLAFILMLIRR